MLIRVWEYDVAEGAAAEFERVYGPAGEWATLFSSAEGFAGTELFVSLSTPGRYLTIDRFEDEASWRRFQTGHRDAYLALDAATEGLTLSERELAGADARPREGVRLELTHCRPEHRAQREAFLRHRHALRIARRGQLVDALDHPAMLALWEGEVVGVATYVPEGDSCELLTLHAETRLKGIGTALLNAVRDIARDAGCRRLWVVTTNDNVDALRFYQRRGSRLVGLRPGAVDQSRDTLKPEIPRTGEHGIPLRDELELQLTIGLDCAVSDAVPFEEPPSPRSGG